MVGRPALSAAWRTTVPVCLSFPTIPSCTWAAVLRAPFREPAELLDRALDVRADPFADRERVAPLLDAFDRVRLAPFDAVREVFAVVRVVPVFADCVRFLAAPLAAEPVREAGFDAVAPPERLVLLLPPPARGRFVVAMFPSQECDPRILRSLPTDGCF
jgi:hypothetical protein